MATPPMLRRRDVPVDGPARRPDPVAGLTVLLLVGVAAGLLLAAILAVYDYTTPAIETPLVTIVALIFIATLVFNILAAGVRSLGSRR